MPRIVWQSLQLYLCQTLLPDTTSSVSLSVLVRLGMEIWVSIVSQMKMAVQTTVPQIKKLRAVFLSIKKPPFYPTKLSRGKVCLSLRKNDRFNILLKSIKNLDLSQIKKKEHPGCPKNNKASFVQFESSN